jgi:protein-tyrosine phosphatase
LAQGGNRSLACCRRGHRLSLLTPEEKRDLELGDEGPAAQASGMGFLSLPIPDRQVPSLEENLAGVLERADADLASGKNVLVHCRQGSVEADSSARAC